MKDKNIKELTIRNSTVEFLIFTTNNAQDTIEVKIKNETLWLTQKLIAKLFDVLSDFDKLLIEIDIQE